MDFSVVIPSYNEYKNLKILIPKINKTFSNYNFSYEILIILKHNNNIKPKSICNNVVRVFRKNDNSFGSALKTGIFESKGDYIITIDADGSHNPEELEKIFDVYKNYDLICFSRYVIGGDTQNQFILKFMSLALNLIFKYSFDLKIKDISNNFKIYKSSLLKKLKLNSKNFDIIEEIIIKLSRNRKISLIEIPSNFHSRGYGKTKRSLVLFMISFGITYCKLFIYKFF